MESNKINLDEICRCCKQNSSDLAFIYEENNSDPEYPRIDEMIMSCTSVTAHRGDGLPSHLCIQCLDRLKIGYAIRRDFEQADSELRIHLRTQQATTSAELMTGILHDFFDNDLQEAAEELNNFKKEPDDSTTNDVKMHDQSMEETAEDIDIQVDLERVEKFQKLSRIFECTMCSTEYNSQKSLRKHIQRNHTSTVSYRCKICQKIFRRAEHLKRHLYIHLKERPFVCDKCKRTFNRQEHLDSHIIVCDGKNTFSCDVCNKGFAAEIALTVHRKIHEGVEGKSQCCLEMADLDNYGQYCEKIDLLHESLEFGESSVVVIKEEFLEDAINDDGEFAHNSDVDAGSDYMEEIKKKRGRRRKRKRVVTTGRKRGRPPKNKNLNTQLAQDADDIGSFECPICFIVFTRLTLLELHGKEAHRDDHVLRCTECAKSFARIYTLKRHQRTHQTDLNTTDNPSNEQAECNSTTSFPCHICLKSFTLSKYLQAHLKTHNREKTFVCPKCGKSFSSKSNLTEHMKFHSDHEKKFLCSECGQRFIRNDYLVIHMRRHRGEKPFKCKYCNRGFPRSTDLTVHERYHTGVKTHLCTICGRGFSRSYNLTVHMRTHTGEKPYKCPYCESAFAQCNDLKAHVRRHTGERFHCDLCSETFLMGYALTQHKRNVHGLNVVANIRRLPPIESLNQETQPETTMLPQSLESISTTQ